MEIRVKKELIDGYLKTTLSVENLTKEELDLFDKYGEPTIDIGGAVERIYLDSPVLLYPDINETNISATPTLTWESVDGATSYSIQIADNIDFNNPQEYTSLTESKDVSLLNDSNYYWRVAAIDSIGTGPWSDSRHFTTIAAIPSIPTLYTPANNATSIPTNVLFTWESIPYNINIVRYDIEIAIDIDFQNIIESPINLIDSNYTSSILGNITQYYWRVRAKNTIGNSDWSEIFTFTTIIPIPEPPILITPIDGELNGVSHQAFDWEDTTYANSYHFQLSGVVDFNFTYIDQEFIAVSSYTVSDEFNLTNGNTYYWRVRALGTQGYSNWSEIRTLTINESLIPNIPVLTFPIDGATDVNPSIYSYYWEASDRADEYTFQISQFSDFSSIDLEQSPNVNYIEIYDLLPNTQYYWRVNAINYTYGISDWSTVRSLTTQIVLPAIPTLNTPANGSTSTSLANNFSWNIAARATSYDIQIATDSNFDSVISGQANLTTAFAQYTFPSNATYYWRVRANNTYGSSAWASGRSIIINAVIPLNPSQITNNNFWVRSDTGVTTVTGNKVSQWSDQSGGGNHLLQTTDANRPVLTANVYGSVSGIYFDPTTTKRSLGYNDTTKKFEILSASTKTMMITFLPDQAYSYANNPISLFSRSNASYGDNWLLGKYNDNLYNIRGVYQFPKFNTNIVTSLPVVELLIQAVIICNNSVVSIYFNGTKLSENTVSSLTTPISNETGTYFTIGSEYHNAANLIYYKGYVFEAAFWTKALSASEVASLYAYHKNYFGIS